MILGFFSRIPAIAWVFAIMVVLGLLFVKQYQHNAVLQAELVAVQKEKSDAEAEKARLVESDRKHAAALAAARKSYADAARRLASSPDDGCLDRRLPPDIGSALRVPAKDRKANAASSGRPKADAPVSRNDVQRSPDPHP